MWLNNLIYLWKLQHREGNGLNQGYSHTLRPKSPEAIIEALELYSFIQSTHILYEIICSATLTWQ